VIGVEGDHLVVDGDIDIEHSVSPRRHRLLQCEPHSGGGCKQLESNRGQDRQGDRHEQSGVERECLDGDRDGHGRRLRDLDFDYKKSNNLPRVSLSEGRGEVSVMKVEGDF
jgi:hypothetical protein